MTNDEWDDLWDSANADHDFIALAIHWHSGQWSAFYKLQCNGRVLDATHAWEVGIEARRNLASIDESHEDHDAMKALMDITDQYPDDEEDTP